MRMTERWVVDADPQNILKPPTDGGHYIFTTYNSASGITLMRQAAG